MDANRISPGYELKDELARFCLPTANREPELKLAWVNSVCLLFLLIGIARRAARHHRHQTGPAHPGGSSRRRPAGGVAAAGRRPKTGASGTKQSAARPRRPAECAGRQLRRSDRRHAGRARRARVRAAGCPGAHRFAQQHRRGRRTARTALSAHRPRNRRTGHGELLLGGDAAGNVISVDVKESSGFPVLDRATVDFIKHHWRLPAGDDNRFLKPASPTCCN